MSDFLRITTPLVNKSQNVQPTQRPDPSGAFSIQNTTKVVQSHNQSELLKQNTGLLEQDEAPTLLLSLLKDPGVTVSYLKNVFMLEELYTLLPANNKTVTKEIANAFDLLLLKPEELPGEMKNQENDSTAFKGEPFDFLRELSQNNRSKAETQLAIAQFLRALFSSGNNRDILESVANNLRFLREELSPSQRLSERLDALILQYISEDARDIFPELKTLTLELLKDIEGSILFSPKHAKTLSILTYNLSRYNTSPDFLMDAGFRLRSHMNSQEISRFIELFEPYIAQMLGNDGMPDGSVAGVNDSRIMTLLTELISGQIEYGKGSASEAAKLESILYSLLSSPCNFTPLLHFILPLQYNDMRAFAELWINPDSDEKDMPEGAGSGIHILMVIDAEETGRFETEFFVYNSTIDFLLLCPERLVEEYSEMTKDIPRLLAGTDYRLGKTRVASLEKTRSLMEVFKSLPYRRVGVDVKI